MATRGVPRARHQQQRLVRLRRERLSLLARRVRLANALLPCPRLVCRAEQGAGGYHHYHGVGDGALLPELPRSKATPLFIGFAFCSFLGCIYALVLNSSWWLHARIAGCEGPNPSSKSSSNLTAATFVQPLAVAVSSPPLVVSPRGYSFGLLSRVRVADRGCR
jgi:transcription factor TGA